jgi:hypothetical protein
VETLCFFVFTDRLAALSTFWSLPGVSHNSGEKKKKKNWLSGASQQQQRIAFAQLAEFIPSGFSFSFCLHCDGCCCCSFVPKCLFNLGHSPLF